jgi:hypothetical protein
LLNGGLYMRLGLPLVSLQRPYWTMLAVVVVSLSVSADAHRGTHRAGLIWPSTG